MIDSIAITCCINFSAKKRQKNLGKIVGSHDWLNSYHVASTLVLKKAKNLGKYKIFLMLVYMIYFYSKRFRFTPSFNNLEIIMARRYWKYLWGIFKNCPFFASQENAKNSKLLQNSQFDIYSIFFWIESNVKSQKLVTF